MNLYKLNLVFGNDDLSLDVKLEMMIRTIATTYDGATLQLDHFTAGSSNSMKYFTAHILIGAGHLSDLKMFIKHELSPYRMTTLRLL